MCGISPRARPPFGLMGRRAGRPTHCRQPAATDGGDRLLGCLYTMRRRPVAGNIRLRRGGRGRRRARETETPTFTVSTTTTPLPLTTTHSNPTQTKGTSSFGKRHSKTHTTCRRCGKVSYHLQKKVCASCGYPAAKMKRCTFLYARRGERRSEGPRRARKARLRLGRRLRGVLPTTACPALVVRRCWTGPPLTCPLPWPPPRPPVTTRRCRPRSGAHTIYYIAYQPLSCTPRSPALLPAPTTCCHPTPPTSPHTHPSSPRCSQLVREVEAPSYDRHWPHGLHEECVA